MSRRLSVTISDAMYDALCKEAESEGRSIAAVLGIILRDYIVAHGYPVRLGELLSEEGKDLSKKVSFSVADNEYKILECESLAKGMTLSSYCKMAAFSHANKYPTKGITAELARKKLGLTIDPSDVITREVIDEVKRSGAVSGLKNGKPIKGGSVYLITKKDNPSACKIGISGDVESRIENIEMLGNLEIELIHSFPTRQVRRVEIAVHEHYAAKRVKGEWFCLGAEDIRSFPMVVEHYSGMVNGSGPTADALDGDS